MKLEYGKLGNETFRQALNKIMNHPVPPQMSFRLNDLMTKMNKENDAVTKEYLTIMETFKSDQTELQKAVEVFAKKEIEIDHPLINLNTLPGIQLSAVEVEMLKPMIEPSNVIPIKR